MKIENIQIDNLGSNRYGVGYTLDGERYYRKVDFDELDPITNEDCRKLEAAGLCDDHFAAPMHYTDGDVAFALACKEAALNSGFDADAYISRHKGTPPTPSYATLSHYYRD